MATRTLLDTLLRERNGGIPIAAIKKYKRPRQMRTLFAQYVRYLGRTEEEPEETAIAAFQGALTRFSPQKQRQWVSAIQELQ